MCAESVFSSRSYLCCGFEDYPTLSFCGFQETLLHSLRVKTVANKLCPLSLNLVRSNTCRLTSLLIKYLSLNLSFDPRESAWLWRWTIRLVEASIPRFNGISIFTCYACWFWSTEKSRNFVAQYFFCLVQNGPPIFWPGEIRVILGRWNRWGRRSGRRRWRSSRWRRRSGRRRWRAR